MLELYGSVSYTHLAKQEAFELTMHPFCRNAVAAMDWGGTIMNKYLSNDNNKVASHTEATELVATEPQS